MSESESQTVVCRHGDIWIAAQPSEADLDQWAADGVKMIVNSRTPGETSGLSFYLPEAVETRGMRYVELPIGGTYGASAVLTATLGDLLAEADGPVVMHCRTGGRSAHLYAAHLVDTGQDGEDPFDTMNWPGPRDMNMVRALVPVRGA